MSRNYDETNKEIGQRIRQRREELHMTQEELATKLGYKSKSTINKIESGINSITQGKLKAFAEALDTTELYLLQLLTTPERLEGHELLYEQISSSLSKNEPFIPYDDEELLSLEEKKIILNYRQFNYQNKTLVQNIIKDIIQIQQNDEIKQICKLKNYKYNPEKYQNDFFISLQKSSAREHMNNFFYFKSRYVALKYISSLDGLKDIIERYSVSDEEIVKLANILYYSNS